MLCRSPRETNDKETCTLIKLQMKGTDIQAGCILCKYQGDTEWEENEQCNKNVWAKMSGEKENVGREKRSRERWPMNDENEDFRTGEYAAFVDRRDAESTEVGFTRG